MKKMAFFFALLVGCSTVSPQYSFDEARTWRHAEKIVGFGQRIAGSAELRECAGYIMSELATAGVAAEVETFSDAGIEFRNIIATIPGRDPGCIAMLTCHYDLKKLDPPMEGANDGASAAAVLLELARQIKDPPFTVMLVWFDGEECLGEHYTEKDGLYGSRKLAETMEKDGRLGRVAAFLNADMVGLPDATFTLPANTDLSMFVALSDAAAKQGLTGRVSFYAGNILDDHEPFRQRGVPTLNLIAFNDPAWHTPGDNLAHISPRSLAETGRLILGFLDELKARQPARP